MLYGGVGWGMGSTAGGSKPWEGEQSDGAPQPDGVPDIQALTSAVVPPIPAVSRMAANPSAKDHHGMRSAMRACTSKAGWGVGGWGG